MAKEVLFLVQDADEGGYVARALSSDLHSNDFAHYEFSYYSRNSAQVNLR